MSVFSLTETKRQTKEEERERIRLEKRDYRDLRHAIDRYPVTEQDWHTLLTLHSRYGREGARQLTFELIPSWSLRQESIPNGCPCPSDLWDQWKPEATSERTSARKVRIDSGKARKSPKRSSKN